VNSNWPSRMAACRLTIVDRCPDDTNLICFTSYFINDFLAPHHFGAPDLDFSRPTRFPGPSAGGPIQAPSDRFYLCLKQGSLRKPAHGWRQSPASLRICGQADDPDRKAGFLARSAFARKIRR
jgi:hypothetical protein